MISRDIKIAINNSVLCWLATASADGLPNVSPKEIFIDYGNEHLLIANIASPVSAGNIRQNKNVCVSFIDILVQKGYQLKGEAVVIEKSNVLFDELECLLKQLAGEDFQSFLYLM